MGLKGLTRVPRGSKIYKISSLQQLRRREKRRATERAGCKLKAACAHAEHTAPELRRGNAPPEGPVIGKKGEREAAALS